MQEVSNDIFVNTSNGLGQRTLFFQYHGYLSGFVACLKSKDGMVHHATPDELKEEFLRIKLVCDNWWHELWTQLN